MCCRRHPPSLHHTASPVLTIADRFGIQLAPNADTLLAPAHSAKAVGSTVTQFKNARSATSTPTGIIVAITPNSARGKDHLYMMDQLALNRSLLPQLQQQRRQLSPLHSIRPEGPCLLHQLLQPEATLLSSEVTQPVSTLNQVVQLRRSDGSRRKNSRSFSRRLPITSAA